MFYANHMFASIWSVTGTKGIATGPGSGHVQQSSSIAPEALFWIWLLVSFGIFCLILRALFSHMDGAFLHLPSRGKPPKPRRICACGYKPDSDEEDCPQCGLKLPGRVAEHLQKYCGPGRRSGSIK